MARRYAGMSQSDLAARIGVQRSAVSHWERSPARNPSIANMQRILLDSVAAIEGMVIDDELEMRLVAAFRNAPNAARIALVEVSEHLLATRNPPRKR